MAGKLICGRMTQPSLLGHPDFMRLWTAQSVSAVGSRFTRTALPIVAISGLAATKGEIGVLSALGFVASVAVGLVLGGWIDQQTKRPLLVAMDLVRAASVAAIPVAWAMDALNVGLLFAVAVMSGAASAIFHTADNAYLPMLIAPSQLVEGNSKLQTSESVAEIVGPGLAGVLIQMLGWPVAMVADALSYIWSAAWLSRIANPAPPAMDGAPEGHVMAGIRQGLRLVWVHPLVRPLWIAQGVQAFFGGFFMALYMVFALTELKLGEAAVGLIIGVGGAGALLGVALTGPARRQFGAGGAILLGLALGQAGMLLIPLSAVAGPLTIPALIAHQLVSDGAFTIYLILSGSLRQTVIPQDLLARAQSAFTVSDGLAMTTGALASGVLADAIGTTPVVWIGVIGGLTAIIPVAISRLPGLKEFPVS